MDLQPREVTSSPLRVLVLDGGRPRAQHAPRRPDSRPRPLATTSVADVPSLLRTMQDGAPDVCVIDLSPDPEARLEALRDVRASGWHGPLVALSDGREPDLEDRARDAGADDVVVAGDDGARGWSDAIHDTLAHRQRLEPWVQKTNTLEAERARLETMVARQNEFLAVVAHDLRGPVGIVLGCTRLLETGLDTASRDEQRRLLAHTRHAVQRMAALIDDLLDLAAIASGHVTLHTTEEDLVHVVAPVVEAHGLLAAPKGIRLACEVDGHVRPVRIDAGRIEQAIQNLITNAIKYSHPGSEVRVRLAQRGPCARLSVEDDGVGMNLAEDRPSFVPFQRGSTAGTGGEKSTGLGLAIVQRIVEAHGGGLFVESAPGRGTCAGFELPCVN